MNHTTSAKCSTLAANASASSTAPPRPANAIATVTKINPPGLAVVGLDISSKNARQHQIALTKKSIAEIPPK